MSTIKSKDLSFNKQEPAFLRRIREANSGHGDRHERPIARPQRLRDPAQDEEDAPTYVDEEGGTLSKAEYDALVASDRNDQYGEDATGINTKPEETVGGNVEGELKGTEPKASGAIREEARKATMVDVGGPSKKRKVAKVIGGESEGAEAGAGEGGAGKGKTGAKKAKKKGKPIKLSFGDDEA